MVLHRQRFLSFGLLALLTLFAVPLVTTHGQATEPTTIIDAAFADISKQVGKPVTRGGDSTFSWEQDTFGDSSLGCPKPGLMYAQVVSQGYKIIINYAGVAYDYRSSLNGANLFLCSTTGGVATFVATAPAAPTPGSATLTNPFAFVAHDGNVVVAHIGDSTTVALTNDSTVSSTSQPPFFATTQRYGRLQWSPDGSKLLFYEFKTGNLYLVISGQPPIRISTGLQTFFPAVWSADSTKIAYAVQTQQANGSGEVQQIQSVSLSGNSVSAPQYAGTFTQGTGCGGGDPDPASQLYDTEAGFRGNALVMTWTDKGFVASPNCTGNGLALTDSTGKVLWHVDNAAHVAFSPDRTRAVAVKIDPATGLPPVGGNALMLIDLSTGAVTPLQSEAGADQLAWSADGNSILYSTLTNPQSIKATGNNPVGAQLFGTWPFEGGVNGGIPSYTVTLWRVAASGGASTQLFQRTGRGIGVITAAPDNTGVLTSFVTSTGDMINAINDNLTVQQALATAPTVQLLYVAWDGSTPPTVIAQGGEPAFGKGSFAAIGMSTQAAAVVGSANVAPPNLIVGAGAIVTTTNGDTLNVRQSPSKGAPVMVILKAGAILKVMAGPQSAEGLRWWQVRTTEGVIGWVADQVTDQEGTTNTLVPTS